MDTQSIGRPKRAAILTAVGGRVLPAVGRFSATRQSISMVAARCLTLRLTEPKQTGRRGPPPRPFAIENDPFVFTKVRPLMSQEIAPLVGVIMGSRSDWEVMQHAHATLSQFGIPHECRVVSAHRTPDFMRQYAQEAEKRGLAVIIAGAGGAAHLPGMVSSHTTLPVLGVPVTSAALNGIDSLLSIVQMPGGVPVGTLAIGKAGAINAALLAIRILAIERPLYRAQLHAFQQEQTERVLGEKLL